MAHGNIEVVRRSFAIGADAAATGDPEPPRGLIHPEFEFAPHITGGHEGIEFHGYEGFASFVRVQAETWASLRAEPSQMRKAETAFSRPIRPKQKAGWRPPRRY
jgi:hypothetical protein